MLSIFGMLHRLVLNQPSIPKIIHTNSAVVNKSYFMSIQKNPVQSAIDNPLVWNFFKLSHEPPASRCIPEKNHTGTQTTENYKKIFSWWDEESIHDRSRQQYIVLRISAIIQNLHGQACDPNQPFLIIRSTMAAFRLLRHNWCISWGRQRSYSNVIRSEYRHRVVWNFQLCDQPFNILQIPQAMTAKVSANMLPVRKASANRFKIFPIHL